MRRTAQITATARPTSRTDQRTAITNPATMPNTIFSATSATAMRTTHATRRRPKAPNAECCCCCSMRQIVPADFKRSSTNDRPAAPEEEGGAAGHFFFDRWESVVGVLQVREARVARGLAGLEPQPGEPVAADELVAAAGGRDEHEAARRGCGRALGGAAGTRLGGGERGGGHGKHDRGR